MKKNLSILVNSCDLYESAWDPFFKLFAIQWPDCPYDIYLNTETKEYSCGCVKVTTLPTGEGVPWTARVRRALKEIDSEYILFFLEDFFLLEKVDQALFEHLVDSMDQNPSVGFVFFRPLGERSTVSHPINEYLMEIPRQSSYRANACLGLWRKEFLLQMLYEDCDPWTFEHTATKLSRFADFKCCYVMPKYQPVLSYSLLLEYGYGITFRKWLGRNKELFEKYGIEVDFDQLGIMEWEPPQPKENKTDKKKKKRNGPLAKLGQRITRKMKKIKRYFQNEREIAQQKKELEPGFRAHCQRLKEESEQSSK